MALSKLSSLSISIHIKTVQQSLLIFKHTLCYVYYCKVTKHILQYMIWGWYLVSTEYLLMMSICLFQLKNFLYIKSDLWFSHGAIHWHKACLYSWYTINPELIQQSSCVLTINTLIPRCRKYHKINTCNSWKMGAWKTNYHYQLAIMFYLCISI